MEVDVSALRAWSFQMTRSLLIALAEPAPSPGVEMAMVFGVAILLPLAVASDLVAWLMRIRPAPLPETVGCPVCGRRVRLIAHWTCGGCRATTWRHAFERCEFCESETRFVSCGCGSSIPNRWTGE